jgi:hypothetical protein
MSTNKDDKRKEPLSFDAIMAFKEAGDMDRCSALLKAAYLSSDNDLRALACYELALLNCQSNNHIQADMYLRKLGYRYKLSKSIWQYGAVGALSSTSHASCGLPGVVQCFDEALPAPLLQRLRDAFAPASPFWTEHAYPSEAFFSGTLQGGAHAAAGAVAAASGGGRLPGPARRRGRVHRVVGAHAVHGSVSRPSGKSLVLLLLLLLLLLLHGMA